MKKIDIKIKEALFRKRISITKNEIPFLIMICVFIVINFFVFEINYIALILASLVSIFFLLKGLYVAVFYIIKISEEKDFLLIDYYKLNKLYSLKIPISDLEIEIGKGIKSIGASTKVLLFKQNKKVIFKQNQILDWDDMKIEKVYNQINDFKKEWNDSKKD